MPLKKAAAAAASAPKKDAPKTKSATKSTTTKATTTKATSTKTAEAKPGRGRPKKMSTEDAPKTSVKEKKKKEVTEEPKKTKTAKTTKTTKTTTTTSAASKKRKAEEEEEEKPREPKKPRVIAQPRERKAKAPVKPKATKPKVAINEAPKTRLNVYVCGEGSSGELGLGTAKNVIDVKRPRLNQLLSADKVGVVQLAIGGMHCVALTHDNKLLSWGVNDQGALGRDTDWDGGYKDMDDGSDSDSDDEDSGLNPRESTPTDIPASSFPEGTIFVQVAAADSASFALTDEGKVYGWGTFRSNDGILGFDSVHEVQKTPILLPDLKNIKYLTCGSNHALALNDKGAVFSWGSGQQNQLGRRIVERNKLNGLQPREFGLPKNIVHIGSGAYHSFAVHSSGKVYAWGLNSFGATALQEGAGDDEAAVVHPVLVKALSSRNIAQVVGGSHHSIARTTDGECLVWGRLDGFQSGLKLDALSNDAVIKDERGRPRILIEPTIVPGIKAEWVSASSDHSLAIDADGRAWSWGFSANYQTGQGTADDIEVATIIDNTAVRGKKLNWAGAGGQFSVFADAASC
ncbi:Regulator of chromosome condensation RCC1 [Penicillium angulare]|uniref:Regulator of chromosome condensation RCC1 n=1 Tax=Penicillium angulare TaxID=116970 RepID=UPI002541419E|nr:Regulator of chromosome condensation RCC1 [Penicillium angulare]KAJ5273952.1 Regulator of chromosome condensation RCC1 [Penicillium angulare]